MSQSNEQWEKVRPQFDTLPYPNQPLEADPRRDLNYLAGYVLATAFYLRDRRVVDTQGKWILDAGCGSGLSVLALALANPGAHIVGVDLSSKSLAFAQKRLDYHGIQNSVTFHCLPLEELPTLEQTFDYINCEDVLYLLADPTDGLRAMKAVLKPEGMIRVNMHSALNRASIYRAQAFFTQLGCLVGAPTPEEMTLARQTMKSLHDWVQTKQQTWKPKYEENDEVLMMNYLFRGDKGVTMQEFSSFLKEAKLEFISMVDWRKWNLETLFKSIEELPIQVALKIAEMSIEEQHYLFELLHPIHRLLDLYCGHPRQAQACLPIQEWNQQRWETATVHLHPLLCTETFKQVLMDGATKLGLIHLHALLDTAGTFFIDASVAACLSPLIDTPQAMTTLVKRWQQMSPLDPITLEPSDPIIAFNTIRACLTQLEDAGYVMLE